MNRQSLDYSVSPNRKTPYTSYRLNTEHQPMSYETTNKKRYYNEQRDQEFQTEVTRDLQQHNTNLYKTYNQTDFNKHEDQIKQLIETLKDQDRELSSMRQIKEQYNMNQGTIQNQSYRIKDSDEQCSNLMIELNQKNNEIDHLKNKIGSQTSLLKVYQEAIVRVKELEQMKLMVIQQDEQRDLQEQKEETQSQSFKKFEEAFRQKHEKQQEEIQHLKTLLSIEESKRDKIIQNKENELQVKQSQIQGQLNQYIDKAKQLNKQNEQLQKSLERSNLLVDQLEGALKDLQKQYEQNKQAVEQQSRKNRLQESNLIKDSEGLYSQVSGLQKDNMMLQSQFQEKDEYLKQIITDLNNKLLQSQDATEELLQENQEIQRYNNELKANVVSYKTLIDEMKKMQGEQSQKDQEIQKMEVKDISYKYASKLDQVTQDNYQLRVLQHQCEEEIASLRSQLQKLSIQNKLFQDNQSNFETELYIGREKQKDLQQRFENELKNIEEKNLYEYKTIEEKAIQMSEKLSRKIQGLQALVKDRNYEIEVLQSQKNELLLKLCEGDSTYNNVKTNRVQKKETSDLDSWR